MSPPTWKLTGIGLHVFQHKLVCIDDSELVLENLDHRTDIEVLGAIELWLIRAAVGLGHPRSF